MPLFSSMCVQVHVCIQIKALRSLPHKVSIPQTMIILDQETHKEKLLIILKKGVKTTFLPFFCTFNIVSYGTSAYIKSQGGP